MTDTPVEPTTPPAEPVPAPAPTTTTTTRRTRTAVTATPPEPTIEDSPTETPVEVQHTPTPPVGTIGTYPEAVTNIPPGSQVKLARDPAEAAPPAAMPTSVPAASTLEVAAPAPLPRPGDEQLVRGTAAGNELFAELSGQEIKQPTDPESDEAVTAAREARTQQLEQEREALEAAAANEQKLLDANARLQQEQQAR
jgi:hypothetical protein